MIRFCFVLIFFLFCVHCIAADCSEMQSCQSCVATPGCGYCTASGQCLEGDATGPFQSSCLVTWQFGSCPVCSQASTCRSCVMNPACGWCETSSQCQPIGDSTCALSQRCPCSSYVACEDCTASNGCGWCGHSTRCTSLTNGTCDEGFTPLTTCNCVDNHDCLSCLGVSQCGWCVSAQNCQDLNSRLCVVNTNLSACIPPMSFDGTNFVGGMFLVIGTALVGLGLYWICGWWAKRSVNKHDDYSIVEE